MVEVRSDLGYVFRTDQMHFHFPGSGLAKRETHQDLCYYSLKKNKKGKGSYKLGKKANPGRKRGGLTRGNGKRKETRKKEKEKKREKTKIKNKFAYFVLEGGHE